MTKCHVLIVVSATLLCGRLALAQPPGPSLPAPAVFPGVMPMGPSGTLYGFTNPGTQPFVVPAQATKSLDPGKTYLPQATKRVSGSNHTSSPTSGGNGGSISEPYLFSSEQAPATAAPTKPGTATTPPTLTPAVPSKVISAEPTYHPADLYVPGASSEPYVLHEGPRSQAEMKEDNVHVWAQLSYIHWWIRRAEAPPLVTTSTDPVALLIPGTSGAIGRPDTATVIGNNIGNLEFSGIKGSLGTWFDDEHRAGLEICGFWLGTHRSTAVAASDANGSPVLSRPMVNTDPRLGAPGETVSIISFPGVFSGSATVQTSTALHGVELNCLHNIYRICGWSFDYLCGFRYAYLHDDLTITQITNGLGGAQIGFPGLSTGDARTIIDSYSVSNRFYGGQLGFRVNWAHGPFDLGLTSKIAIGANVQNANVDGNFSTISNGVITAFHQGLFTKASNIGEHSSCVYSAIPEINATAGFRVHDHVRLLVGYDFLYWCRIQRAAEQIDRTATNPLYPANRTDFWAQGVNVGLEFCY